jgi:hypothetical protein
MVLFELAIAPAALGVADDHWPGAAAILRAILAILALAALIFVVLPMVLSELLRRSLLKGVPRMQSIAFVQLLRQRVFKDPLDTMARLLSDRGDEYLRTLWRECGQLRTRRFETGVVRFKPLGELPDEGLGVQRMQTRDGQAVAMIRLPQPQKSRETYLAAVVLPQDEQTLHDPAIARQRVGFFVVNRWESGGRNTDFCEYTAEGELTYNIGAPRDPEGFLAMIEEKLRKPRARPVVVR